MNPTDDPGPETDPRFPSGRWTGYFLQPVLPGRHLMELALTFRQGQLTGEGRDWVGRFVLRGRYDLADGKCFWTKRYLGKHDVFYKGFNEGKGIWGVWEIPAGPDSMGWRGGFHIWPEGMADPSQNHLAEEAEVPMEEPSEAAVVLLRPRQVIVPSGSRFSSLTHTSLIGPSLRF